MEKPSSWEQSIWKRRNNNNNTALKRPECQNRANCFLPFPTWKRQDKTKIIKLREDVDVDKLNTRNVQQWETRRFHSAGNDRLSKTHHIKTLIMASKESCVTWLYLNLLKVTNGLRTAAQKVKVCVTVQYSINVFYPELVKGQVMQSDKVNVWYKAYLFILCRDSW